MESHVHADGWYQSQNFGLTPGEFLFVDFYLILKQKDGNLERYFGDYSDAGCKWTGHYDILQMDKASRIVFVGQIFNKFGTGF